MNLCSDALTQQLCDAFEIDRTWLREKMCSSRIGQCLNFVKNTARHCSLVTRNECEPASRIHSLPFAAWLESLGSPLVPRRPNRSIGQDPDAANSASGMARSVSHSNPFRTVVSLFAMEAPKTMALLLGILRLCLLVRSKCPQQCKHSTHHAKPISISGE